MFSYVQQQNAIQETERSRIDAKEATERARIEAQTKEEHEWGLKVIDMYFAKRELFDLTTNTEQAALNLRVLAAVAPAAVQGVLNAERSRIPPPSTLEDANRLNSLAAVAGVQDALTKAAQSPVAAASNVKPADFTVYVQYPDGGRDTAIKTQSVLTNLGYRVPGIEQVRKVPSRLQVRYYRPDQSVYAATLVAELGKALKLPGDAVLVRSSKELPTGIMEVWLPTQQG
jgi:hypothetical protein